MDVVSGGEAHFSPVCWLSNSKNCIFGIGKNHKELTEAVEKKIFQINVESFEELKRLADICKTKKTSCAIGLRINPDIDFESLLILKPA